MKISKLERREAKELYRSCLSNGLLDENRVRQAVKTVLAEKPRGYLAILSQFQRLVKLDIERRSATVQSTGPLSAQEQAAVQSNLLAKYGPGLNITYAQNPDLIGGLRILVGSDVYDGSVRGRLESLRDSF